MPYTPILGTLGYILSPDRTKTLLIFRHGRDSDISQGKYSGLGGKLEANEDIVTGMKREIFEEAGIVCGEMKFRGTISWPSFGPKNEDWFGFLFLIETFTGDVFDKNNEGTLEWVDIDKLADLPCWEGDKFFLPLVFDHDPRPFHGIMPYKNCEPQSWAYTRI